MITLEFDPQLDELPLVLDETLPSELAMPQVTDQPALASPARGKLSNAEALVARVLRAEQTNAPGGLGYEYQQLVHEYQPLLDWAMASWDYLLSTEGCRFLPRNRDGHWYGPRGDYRAMTSREFSRLAHRIFRLSVLEFARQPQAPSLSSWLRTRFWPAIVEAYRKLAEPADPRQRALTAYSYLRCVPYEFMNPFHQDLVYGAVGRLPERQSDALRWYFLRFCTEPATAGALDCGPEEAAALLRQGLMTLLIRDRLVYCLLRQIERY
ncbi:MAG TPA: hypothetical protein VGB20_01680 [bacterium]